MMPLLFDVNERKNTVAARNDFEHHWLSPYETAGEGCSPVDPADL